MNSIELSYRAELKSLFDAQFGRFHEHLERRLVETTAFLGARIDQVRIELRTELRGDLESVKSDVATLKSDVAALKTDVAALKGDVGSCKGDLVALRVELGSVKSDLIKWMAGLTVGLWVPVALGLVGLFLKL